MQKFVNFQKPIGILAHASAAGSEEARGPLGASFDFCDHSNRFGMETWELAEGELSRTVLALALKKARLSHEKIDLLFSGDLQNQCVASSLSPTLFSLPYIGLYGACSTSAEGLYLASSLLSAGNGPRLAAVVTTSHYCAAERQFRLPIEYGGQRTPTAQWTATAGGAFLLTADPEADVRARITGGMAGVPIDGGISDASNMGAAMAPAAAHTILSFFEKTGEKPDAFDAIVTGDLGFEGSELLAYLLRENGLSLSDKHRDCGKMIYNPAIQDVHGGGSGCGCSASVLSAHFLPLLEDGLMKRVLFLATGALMSPSSLLQGGNIIGVAPLVLIESSARSDCSDKTEGRKRK